MEGVLPFLQAYGPWLALGGGLVLLLRRAVGGGMSCCGAPQQGTAPGQGAAAGASCHQQPAPLQIEGTPPATVVELQVHLATLRAQQEDLARQLAALEAEPAARRPVAITRGGRERVATIRGRSATR